MTTQRRQAREGYEWRWNLEPRTVVRSTGETEVTNDLREFLTGRGIPQTPPLQLRGVRAAAIPVAPEPPRKALPPAQSREVAVDVPMRVRMRGASEVVSTIPWLEGTKPLTLPAKFLQQPHTVESMQKAYDYYVFSGTLEAKR